MEQKPVRVLLIDDDEDEYIITRSLLARGDARYIKLVWEGKYDAALTAIRQNEYDAYLIDYRLGAFNGVDLIQEAIEAGCTAPLILLTGMDDYDLDIEAMDAGASFCMNKGSLDAVSLERTIRYSIRQKGVEAELKMTNAELIQVTKMVPWLLANFHPILP